MYLIKKFKYTKIKKRLMMTEKLSLITTVFFSFSQRTTQIQLSHTKIHSSFNDSSITDTHKIKDRVMMTHDEDCGSLSK